MVDPATYSRYSRPLERQMTVIAQTGPTFLRSVESAAATGQNGELVSAARRLMSELNGRPGDGALAVYRDFESNIGSIQEFLERFDAPATTEARAIISQAKRTHAALIEMRTMVQSTPPRVLKAIKGRLQGDGGSPEEKYHSSVGTPVMFIVMAAILIARGLGFWPASWLIVVPAAFLGGAVAAALVSTVIKSVRGY
jgi:hypothetical protein